MFYELTPEFHEVPLAEVSPDRLTAGIISAQELEGVRERFGFAEAAVEECRFDKSEYRNSVDVYEDYSFGVVNIVDASDVFAPTDRVAFFFKRNLFLMVSLCDEDGSTSEVFFSALNRYKPEAVTLEKVIYAMLEGTIARDAQALARVEFAVSGMEEDVAQGRAGRDFNARIYEKKRELLLLRNYYEQLIDVGEALGENENDIFADDTLHYFALFTAKAERLSANVQLLRDSLNQLREAHQAAMDYSLNRTMQLLTVLATIFLPLSLLTGWYGMNFSGMPELEWEYGYPVLIAACALIVALTFYWFRRKKML